MDRGVKLDSEEQCSHAPVKGKVLSRNDQKWESIREEIRQVYMIENNTLATTMLEIGKRNHFKAS